MLSREGDSFRLPALFWIEFAWATWSPPCTEKPPSIPRTHTLKNTSSDTKLLVAVLFRCEVSTRAQKREKKGCVSKYDTQPSSVLWAQTEYPNCCITCNLPKNKHKRKTNKHGFYLYYKECLFEHTQPLFKADNSPLFHHDVRLQLSHFTPSKTGRLLSLW